MSDETANSNDYLYTNSITFWRKACVAATIVAAYHDETRPLDYAELETRCSDVWGIGQEQFESVWAELNVQGALIGPHRTKEEVADDNDVDVALYDADYPLSDDALVDVVAAATKSAAGIVVERDHPFTGQ